MKTTPSLFRSLNFDVIHLVWERNWAALSWSARPQTDADKRNRMGDLKLREWKLLLLNSSHLSLTRRQNCVIFSKWSLSSFNFWQKRWTTTTAVWRMSGMAGGRRRKQKQKKCLICRVRGRDYVNAIVSCRKYIFSFGVRWMRDDFPLLMMFRSLHATPHSSVIHNIVYIVIPHALSSFFLLKKIYVWYISVTGRQTNTLI